MTLHCYDSPEAEGHDGESPIVLIYEPQSHATPVREAAAAAAIAARCARAQRRRGHRVRQRDGVDGKEERQEEERGVRVGCLTEILWDDVQRARDLLRLSRRRRQEVQLTAADSVANHDDDSMAAPVTATPALRRLKRLHGRSASLGGGARADAPAAEAPSSGTGEHPAALELTEAADQESQISTGTSSSGRLSDLRRILRDLLADRRTDKSLQSVCNASSIGEDSQEAGDIRRPICRVTQFPLETLTAINDNGDCSELRQLQDQAAVQAAVVAANQRLLGECPAGPLASRRMKRRRTLEFVQSQEKLRALNVRIAEIRTRDFQSVAEPQPPSLETLPDIVGDAHGFSLCSLTSLAVRELPTEDNNSDYSAEQSPRHLRKFSSLKSSTSSSTTSTGALSAAGQAGISHAGSLDSGFLEITAEPHFHAAAAP